MNYDQKQEENKDVPISDKEAGALLFMLFGFGGYYWIEKNSRLLSELYFKYFEEIYLSVYVFVAIVIVVLAHFLKKKTAKFAKRAQLLLPKSESNEKKAAIFKKIKVGKTKDNVDLYLSDKDRSAHVQVIGATGRGKTQSVVIPWAVRDLKKGDPVFIIDGKGSPDLYEEIFKRVESEHCRKYLFNLDDPRSSISINPLGSGSPQQITDRLFSAFEFKDPFYRSVQYDICGYLTRLIHEVDEQVSFKLLYALLTSDQVLCDYLARVDEGDLKEKLKSFVKTPAKDRKMQMAGLISQLSPFATSEVSEIVNGGPLEVKFSEELIWGGKTLFIFSIPTLKYQQMGHQLGKLLLQEIAWAVGEKESEKSHHFCSVFLDEFSEFVYEGFVSILNKARSANVSLHLCHQSKGDLTSVSESFAEAVNTNTNIKCVLGVNDPETADFYARHIGTLSTDKLTSQMEEKGFLSSLEETGRASKREVEAYKIHPNVLKELYGGKGVLHFPTNKGVISEIIQFDPGVNL